ncbi:MAG: ABC transporter permease [Acidimicrobiales bacterium]|nr:ABC transporter permease [Acidimicrobiales bacterium]
MGETPVEHAEPAEAEPGAGVPAPTSPAGPAATGHGATGHSASGRVTRARRRRRAVTLRMGWRGRREPTRADPSRLRALDVVHESWLELSRRPLRTVLTGLGVALGTGAVIATQGLVSTVRYQVSDEFDAQLATQVEVRLRSAVGDEPVGAVATPDAGAGFPPSAGDLDRVAALSGVEGVAVLRDSQQEVPVGLARVTDRTTAGEAAYVRGVDAAGLEAVGARITGQAWSSWHDATGQRVALLGRRTADELGLGEVRPGDQVFVDGLGFTLLGIVEDGGRARGLANGVVVPATATGHFLMSEERDRVLVVTAPGAAKDVEAVLPVALSPTDPERYSAYSPTRSDTLRRAVDGSFHSLALALGAVVMGLGLVSIGNATLTSVLQRINEIGIRRALGARPRHIAAHIVVDAALTGAAGGLIGAVGGLAATLAVTAQQGWQPVLDPRLPPLGIVAGALVGAVAGLYPARVGSRLQPTEALRRE